MIDFDEFKRVSTAEWKLKIQADLKGKDYQTLISKTMEGIDIRPFYHYDEYKAFENIAGHHFDIVQELRLANEKVANKIIKNSLAKGADKFIINTSKTFDIDALTDQVDYCRLILRLDFLDPAFFIKLYNKTKGRARILLNPIGHFIKTGNWYNNNNKDFEILKEIQMEVASDFRFIEVDSLHLLNAGAHINQQMTYSLAQAVEYIERLGKEAAQQLVFNMGIGSHYFFEIAKFKTFRYLARLILSEYVSSPDILITAVPGMRNKSLLDPYVNMLRTTMEVMSAILGGVDEVANIPYDKIYKKSNPFSERIARNQFVILKHEAGFEKAINSFEGSYFLEHISYEMADKTLALFKNIEKGGGIIAQLMKGKIQEKVAENAKKEQAKFDKGELVLVGVNKYFNKNEKIETPEIYPFMKKRKGQTLIPPIIAKRLSEEIEKKILQKASME